MRFDTRKLDLAKLNSLTKYPSIPTYHKIDPKNGSLLDEVLVPLTGDLVGTEKLDGANARLMVMPDYSFIIGSREELLYGKDDLIYNSKEGIVDALKNLGYALTQPLVDFGRVLAPSWPAHAGGPIAESIAVLYLEVYGGRIAGSGRAFKRYTNTNQAAYRLFDVAWFDVRRVSHYMTWEIDQFSPWREKGHQPFLTENQLLDFSNHTNVPLAARIPLSPVPVKFEDVLPWLHKTIVQSKCIINEGGTGFAEGIVVRSSDRSKIAKIRFEDYERTIRRKMSDINYRSCKAN